MKFFAGLFAFLLIGLTSCSSDKDAPFLNEPFIQFGANKTKVKSECSNYEKLLEADNILLYKGTGRVDYYAYFFSLNVLTGSIAVLPDDKTNKISIVDFLDNRYHFEEMEDSTYTFVNTNGTISVRLEHDLESMAFNILYSPAYFKSQERQAARYAIKNALKHIQSQDSAYLE